MYYKLKVDKINQMRFYFIEVIKKVFKVQKLDHEVS